MGKHSTGSVLDERLIDFIFQYSAEEQFQTLRYSDESMDDSGLWSRFMRWVQNN